MNVMRNPSKTKGKVYKFVHTKDEHIITNLTGYSFNSEWLEIKEDGTIIVKGSNKRGYAWDGCSPKFVLMDLIFGTPDGRFDYHTKKQITYYASLFHDALYQYKHEIKLSKKDVDRIFLENMKLSGFLLSGIYYFFVRSLGWIYGGWPTKNNNKSVIVYDCSWIKKH